MTERTIDNPALMEDLTSTGSSTNSSPIPPQFAQQEMPNWTNTKQRGFFTIPATPYSTLPPGPPPAHMGGRPFATPPPHPSTSNPMNPSLSEFYYKTQIPSNAAESIYWPLYKIAPTSTVGSTPPGSSFSGWTALPVYKRPLVHPGLNCGSMSPNPFMPTVHHNDPIFNNIEWVKNMKIQAETALDVFTKRLAQLEQFQATLNLTFPGYPYQGQPEMHHLPPPPNIQPGPEWFVPNGDQIFILEKAYQNCPQVDDNLCSSLASIMNATQNQVQAWMAKRRALDKKEQDNVNEGPSLKQK